MVLTSLPRCTTETWTMPRPRTGSLELRKGIWHARITMRRDGKPVARKWVTLDTPDRATATRRLVRVVQEIDAGRRAETAIVAANVPDTIAAYAAAEGKRLAEGDRRNLENYVIPVLGPMSIADLRTANVKAVRDAAITKGLKRGTLGKVLGALRRLLALAVEDELVEHNVASSVHLPALRGAAREIRKERTILTDDEIGAFLGCAAVDLELRMMSLTSRVLGGSRTGDVTAWDWTMIDRVHFAACHVVRSKAAAPQPLEVPEVLRPYLRAWWERAGRPEAGPVFPVRKGTRAGDFRVRRGTSFAKRLRRGLLRAGVIRHACQQTPGAKLPKRGEDCCAEMARDFLYKETATTLPVDFHSFRRAFNSALAETGVNVQRAMRLAGHSDARTHMRYVMQTPAMRQIPEAAALPGEIRVPVAERGKSGRRTVNHRAAPTPPERANDDANPCNDSQRGSLLTSPEPKAKGSNPLWRASFRGTRVGTEPSRTRLARP
jgi:integrase